MKNIKYIFTLFITVAIFNFTNASNEPIINGDKEQIILQKGKDLEITIDQKLEHCQVRVHTSLGRLVKKLPDVNKNVKISTKDWKEGIYIVVIKSGDQRQIKRVLLTK